MDSEVKVVKAEFPCPDTRLVKKDSATPFQSSCFPNDKDRTVAFLRRTFVFITAGKTWPWVVKDNKLAPIRTAISFPGKCPCVRRKTKSSGTLTRPSPFFGLDKKANSRQRLVEVSVSCTDRACLVPVASAPGRIRKGVRRIVFHQASIGERLKNNPAEPGGNEPRHSRANELNRAKSPAPLGPGSRKT